MLMRSPLTENEEITRDSPEEVSGDAEIAAMQARAAGATAGRASNAQDKLDIDESGRTINARLTEIQDMNSVQDQASREAGVYTMAPGLRKR